MSVSKSLLAVFVLSTLSANGKAFFDQPFASEESIDYIDLEANIGRRFGGGAAPVELESEETLFHRAARENDPKRKLNMADEFLGAFPDSRYVDAMRYVRFLGLRDTGDGNAALAAAQAILTRNPTREDVLFYVAHRYFNENRELNKVIDYCFTVIAILEVRTKPASVDESQWIEQRDSALFQTHWLMGSARLLRGEWELADQSLRSALAIGRTGDKNVPAVVSSLAWTNYKMRRIPETIRLYEQCSQESNYAAACKQSLAYIKNEYALQ